jgi:GNAT superfamily N-acetyltransferase
MRTIPLLLDGYTDLPPGKIANVVTYFEMLAPSLVDEHPDPRFSVQRIERPDLAWYRRMFRDIGEDWLWTSYAVMEDKVARARLANPKIDVLSLMRAGECIGIAELDRTEAGEVEINIFGVVGEATGTGAARFLMNRALAAAFSSGVGRVWLHTCTFDHPAAVRFYQKAGFTAYKYAIEVIDDPRLSGHLSEKAAPHIPLIRPR